MSGLNIFLAKGGSEKGVAAGLEIQAGGLIILKPDRLGIFRTSHKGKGNGR